MKTVVVLVAFVVWSFVVFSVGGTTAENREKAQVFASGYVKGVEVCELKHQKP